IIREASAGPGADQPVAAPVGRRIAAATIDAAAWFAVYAVLCQFTWDLSNKLGIQDSRLSDRFGISLPFPVDWTVYLGLSRVPFPFAPMQPTGSLLLGLALWAALITYVALPGAIRGASPGRAMLGLRVRSYPESKPLRARTLLRLACAVGPVGLLLLTDCILEIGGIPLLGLDWWSRPAIWGVAAISLGVGVISLAACRSPKRAWYDKVSKTWVIDLKGRQRQAKRAARLAAQAQARAAAQAQFQAQYAPAGQYGAPPGGIVVVQTKPGTNGLAVAALICGVIGAVGGSVLAIIFGHVARSQIRRTGQDGAGMALAGLILGYIWLGLALAFGVFLIVFAAALS
ncbi:MAG: DUF4190 domain-containing protein, partial [Bifidobacteriaceae bacterium]|nr:DUF4190 domain-containing protein [Bifidobacteriaceae bacterium]